MRSATTQKRGGGEVHGESVFLEAAADGRLAGIDQIIGKEPTPEAVAERLGVDPSVVVEMDQRMGSPDLSIDAPVRGADDNNGRNGRDGEALRIF